MTANQRSPTTVLTGLLGRGKTTVLNHLLHDAAFANAAVLVHECGEVGIDHDLLAFATERLVVLAGGASAVPSMRISPARSGTCAPSAGRGRAWPSRGWCWRRPGSRIRCRVSGGDGDDHDGGGVRGLRNLAEYPQVVQQVVAADILLITKADLVCPEELETLQRTIEALNPWAKVMVMDLHTSHPALAVGSPRVCAPSHDAGSAAWVGRSRAHRDESHEGLSTAWPTWRQPGIRSVAFVFDEPLDWTVFGI
jgi:G3E family GTPase